MIIRHVEITNVRIFQQFQCELENGINLIFGSNGQGKTTILESLFLLSLGKSFRTGLIKNLFRKKADFLRVCSRFTDDSGENKIISMALSNEKRKIKIDDELVKSISDIVGVFPVVVLSPESMEIIDGPASIRRNFINRLFSVVDTSYFHLLREYNRIIKQRKLTLQYGRERETEIWSRQMAVKGVEIWKKKQIYGSRLQEYFKNSWNSEFSGANAEIRLKAQWCTSVDEYMEKLEKQYHREIELGRNLFGPHRDDIEFFYNGSGAKNFASQGEKKSILTVLKHAESHFIREYLKKNPVMLLDDLFAKLDIDRGLKTLKLLVDENQSIITSTDQNISGILEKTGMKIHQIYLGNE